jgi:hypothetical protein
MATTVTLKPNAIDISGSTSGTTTLQATAVAGTTTLTLPAATDTLVGKATTDTLTNKTLTGAVMNGTVGATTPNTGSFTSLAYSTTLTGGTGIVNFGSGQFYKDASGNVGIGTSSPSTYANGFGPVLVAGTGNNFATIQGRTDGPSGSTNGVSYGGSYSTNPINGARITFNAEGGSGQRGSVSFWTKALDDNSTQPLERMRIDSSGNLLVGTTSTSVTSGGYNFLINDGGTGYSTGYIGHATGTPSTYAYLNFKYDGTTIGTITQNGTTAVAYNTSSDYRLKDNIAPMTGALAKVAALKPCTYTWKSAPNEVGEGFIAHELAEVCPHAVTGEKDAVDADGNPKYQGIDTSFLVATLTAAIQEQQALITSLTARITALEDA